MCADQRSQVRGYEDVYRMAHIFRLLLHSYHSGFVGTIYTLFCYVNIKLIVCFLQISIVCLYEIVSGLLLRILFLS